ncbi:MAG: hypothetical protein ACRDUV_07790 [Pseudonocardiaceae bacterium]
MSDAMSFAELGEQYVELLPARTVLSLLHATATGANGDPGTHGANGEGVSKFNFLGMFGYGGSDSSYSFSFTGSGSSAHGSHG